jgi:tape measure domain-containing protein
MATETEVLMLRLEANMKRYEAALARAQGQSNKAFGGIEAAAKRMESTLAGVGRGALEIGASLGVAFGAGQLAGGILDTALSFDRINKAMVAATGSSAAARAEMDFVRQTSEFLGLELASTAQQYAFLAAAARGTALEGQKTRDIFKGVATAASTLGLTAADTAGVLNAVQQMISKGVVSAEELRGQMGERLPGAFAAAARAMNMTTQELGKQLELGNITADELLPKLAAELMKTGNAAGAQGLAAELNRLNNAWTEAKIAIADTGVVSALTSVLQGLSAAARDVSFSLDMIAARRRELQRQGNDIQSALQLASWRDAGRTGPRTVGTLEDGFNTDRMRSALTGGRDAALGFLAARAPKSAPAGPAGVSIPRRAGGGGGGGRRRVGGGGGRGVSTRGPAEEFVSVTDRINKAMAQTRESVTADLREMTDNGLDLAIERGRIWSDEQTAGLRKVSDAYSDLGDTVADAFGDVVFRGEKVQDVLKGILQQLAMSGLRGLFSGSGGLSGSLDTIFTDIFGRAGGGPVNAGQPYRVGETGPELFIPRSPGRISKANSGSGGGPVSITVDLRGTTGDKELDRRVRAGALAAVAISDQRRKGALAGEIAQLKARK